MVVLSCCTRILRLVPTERLCLLIEELCKNLDMPIPISYSGPRLPALVVSLAKRHVDEFANTDRNPKTIADAARYCLLVRLPDTIWDTVGSGLGSVVANARSLKENAAPLVRQLSRLGEELKVLDLFAPAFQVIFAVWVREAKKYSELRSSISQWNCPCSDYTFVRMCLESGEEPKPKHTANKQQREHVDSCVRQYLPPDAVIIECSMKEPFTVRQLTYMPIPNM